ncbi:MAG TPA: hypothetical protein VME41_08125 [Stellaceae bacterium]|nr:hypothetical protein [Stellaceae bacterium]
MSAAGLNLPIVSAAGQSPPQAATAANLPESQRIRQFSTQTLDKIDPGHSTKAEVEALLGKPWRDTKIDDDSITYEGDPSVDEWEYRGQDSQGTYRVHIEFDQHDVTTLIAKISDATGKAVARVATPLWKIDKAR